MKWYVLSITLLASILLKAQEGGPQQPAVVDLPNQNFVQPLEPLNANTAVGNHLVFVDFLQLFFKQVTFGYEYLTDSDNVALRFPITLGLNKKYVEFGTELKFFITKPYTFYRKIGPWDAGDANVRYFLGPALSAISVQGDWAGSARFSNGISMQFIKGLNLSAYASAGARTYFTDVNGFKGDIEFDWSLNGSVGWRFGGAK